MLIVFNLCSKMSDGTWVHPHWAPTEARWALLQFSLLAWGTGCPLGADRLTRPQHPPPNAQGLANWAVGSSSQGAWLQPGARTRRPPASGLQRLRFAAVIYGRTFTAPSESHTAQVSSGLQRGVYRSIDRGQSSLEPLRDPSSQNCLSQPANK